MNKLGEYPQMNRAEVVRHCKKWADEIRAEGVDVLVGDYDVAVNISDQLAYPLDMQLWITAESEPLLDEIRAYAVAVDNEHANRGAWEKLVELIDGL